MLPWNLVHTCGWWNVLSLCTTIYLVISISKLWIICVSNTRSVILWLTCSTNKWNYVHCYFFVHRLIYAKYQQVIASSYRTQIPPFLAGSVCYHGLLTVDTYPLVQCPTADRCQGDLYLSIVLISLIIYSAYCARVSKMMWQLSWTWVVRKQHNWRKKSPPGLGEFTAVSKLGFLTYKTTLRVGVRSSGVKAITPYGCQMIMYFTSAILNLDYLALHCPIG